MQNLVTSKEVSEKLKKLGVKQVSFYYWSDWHQGVLEFGKESEKFRGDWNLVHLPIWNDDTKISAFTVTELGYFLKPYMKDIEISARDDIFNPDFWGNYLIYCLKK